MDRVYLTINGVEIEVNLDTLDDFGMYFGGILEGPLQGYEIRIPQCDVAESMRVKQ